MKFVLFVGLFMVIVGAIVLAQSDRGPSPSQAIGQLGPVFAHSQPASTEAAGPRRRKSGGSGLDFAAAVVYPTGGYRAFAVAVADVNGDGFPDLLLANQCSDSKCAHDGSIAVMLGNGDGTFQAAVTYDSMGKCPTSIAVADLNGDGHLDLAFTEGAKVGVMLGNGDGTFQTPVLYGSGGYNSVWSVVVADVNGDGNADLVVANECSDKPCDKDGSVGVLLGNGDGTFQTAVAYPSGGYNPGAVAIADVNGDGKPDLLVANEQPTGIGSGDGMAGVLLGNGDGTFQSAVPYDSGGVDATSVSVADLDGDGNLDLALVNSYPTSDSLGVLLGNGDGTFQTAVTFASGGYRPFSAAIADVNGDGKPDLLVANQCADDTCAGIATVGVLLNTSTGASVKRQRSSIETPTPAGP